MITPEQKFVYTEICSHKKQGDEKMLKGEYVYIRHQHREGISDKTKKPYNFANATFSDGLESFQMDVNPRIAHLFDGCQKGDHVEVTVSVHEENGRARYQIQHVEQTVNA